MRPEDANLRKAMKAEAAGRIAIRQSLGPSFQEHDAFVERFRRMSLRLGGEVYQLQVGFRRDGDGAHLSEITSPTIIVAGHFDRLRLRAEADELRDGIAKARLVMVSDGHMEPLETPRTLAKDHPRLHLREGAR